MISSGKSTSGISIVSFFFPTYLALASFVSKVSSAFCDGLYSGYSTEDRLRGFDTVKSSSLKDSVGVIAPSPSKSAITRDYSSGNCSSTIMR